MKYLLLAILLLTNLATAQDAEQTGAKRTGLDLAAMAGATAVAAASKNSVRVNKMELSLLEQDLETVRDKSFDFKNMSEPVNVRMERMNQFLDHRNNNIANLEGRISGLRSHLRKINRVRGGIASVGVLAVIDFAFIDGSAADAKLMAETKPSLKTLEEVSLAGQ